MYNGFFSEFQIRPDSTYDRIEVVRNGPSAVFAPEGAAAIINFIFRCRSPRTPPGHVQTGTAFPLPRSHKNPPTLAGHPRPWIGRMKKSTRVARLVNEKCVTSSIRHARR